MEVYSDDGQMLALAKPRQCATLCVLLLSRGSLLTRKYLIEALWGSDPPGDPGGALRSYIYNLRKIGGIGDRLRTHASGYTMCLRENDVLDVSLFLSLTREALQAGRNGDHLTAVERLERAMAIWRTPPLADLPATPVMYPLAEELLETRCVSEEALVDARMGIGDHRNLLPMLKAFTAAKPLRERRWEQLMLALYRSGRQAEALDAYRRARAVLSKEFGLEPGTGLKRLQERVLANDPSLDLRSGATDTVGSHQASLTPIITPRQLPNPVQGFVGRSSELAKLAELAGNVRTSRHSTVVAVISGPPGVGKSSLAVYFAHQVTEYFPDGQLFINLKGFAPPACPIHPAAALSGILEALGIPPERVPATLDARAALYRSLLANRRMLLVAKDALDSTQVQHLVPASPGCMMIVTSRRNITNLVASEGAHLINLDVFSSEEAEAFLASRLKLNRTVADIDVIAELAAQCAYLPLALAVTATHAAERPDLSLADLSAEMRQPRDRLDALNSLEPDSDVRASFRRSYARLTPDAARMFRIMSLHPDPEITVFSAASLAGVPVGEARSTLTELSQMHLVTERFPGGFHFNGLLRSYAAERLEAEQHATEKGAPARKC
jgi:DNA-binding SARP family transcriptional activator